jgi:hypothetical protein
MPNELTPLTNYARQVVSELGFDGPEAEPGDDELELEPAAEEGRETTETLSADEVYQAFMASLDAASRDAAADPTVRDELFREYLEAEGLAALDDDEADDSEREAGGEVRELLADLFAGRAQATDDEGTPIDAAGWIAWAINAPAREWLAACRAVGWDPAQRPTRAIVDEFGHGARGSVFGAEWADHVAKAKERGRFFGQ